MKKSRISSASCVSFFFVVFWSIVCAAHRQRFGINRAPAAWCLKLLYRMQFEVLSGWLTCLVMQIEDGVVASDRAQNFKTFFYNFFVICRFPQSLHFSRCRLECLNSIGGIARPEPERNVFEAQKKLILQTFFSSSLNAASTVFFCCSSLCVEIESNQ